MSNVATSSSHVSVRTVVLTNRTLLAALSSLFFLPSALFALSLRPAAALAVLVGCAGGIALIATRRNTDDGVLSAPIARGRLLMCYFCALAILVVGGEMHIFYTTWDWLVRDAVLADLVSHGFPVGYKIGDTEYLLRAPLGMYLVPAVVGHAFGLLAAHAALLTQNTLLLGAIFYFLITMGAGWGHLAVLVVFAGVSIAGALLRIAGAPADAKPFWLLWGLDAWHPMFQYSGTLVQFFWVPNHALPGWWLATLILLQVRRQTDVAMVGVSIAGVLLWSPLCIVAAIPWLIYCAARSPRRVLLAKRTWLGAGVAACFVPILIYLVSGASSIAGGSTLARPDFVFWYTLFVIVELPVLVFLAFARNWIDAEDRALLTVCGLVLLVLPFFRFGPNNDLVMRGSIIALVVVAFVFGKVVMAASTGRSRLALFGWLLVAFSAPSAAVEIGRAGATPRYAISDCSLMEASRALGDTDIPTNYVTPAASIPNWLINTGAASFLSLQKQTCWPDKAAPRYIGYRYNAVTKPAD